jgi:hypothetical protein
MKKIYLLIVLASLVQYGQSQFVAMPLNYTNDNTFHTPNIISIVDANTVWVATHREDPSTTFRMPYSIAKKTTDGGYTWQSYTIPFPGNCFMADVEAVNTDICYYFLSNLTAAGSSIWKTTDGGLSWINKTPNQFTSGFGDFLHRFGQDTLIALGDPTNGYFEIQISNDGGETWSRVPQADIPPILTGEQGVGGKSFSCVGKTIWFGTDAGRCFKSVDGGYHWTVTAVGPSGGYADVWIACFTDLMHGVFYCKNLIPTQYYKTSDGGVTWTQFYILQDLHWPGISRIDGITDGYIISAQDRINSLHSYVYFTFDFFITLAPIDTVQLSTDYIYFKDAETGWLSGMYHPDSNIYKFTSVLTGIHEKRISPERLTITPNPSSADAVGTFPSALLATRKTIRIYDLTGRLVEERVCEPDILSIHLNAAKYSNGVYTIAVISDNAVVSNCRWVIYH